MQPTHRHAPIGYHVRIELHPVWFIRGQRRDVFDRELNILQLTGEPLLELVHRVQHQIIEDVAAGPRDWDAPWGKNRTKTTAVPVPAMSGAVAVHALHIGQDYRSQGRCPRRCVLRHAL
jgi:hypothetical protein